MTPDNTTNVIKACCVLHNYVRERDDTNFEDTLHTTILEQARWNNYRSRESAFSVRDVMAEYFLSDNGKPDWQDAYA